MVVVTGASSRIGPAAAEGFGRRGAQVALVGRDAGRLDAAVSSVRAAAGPDARPRGFWAGFEVLAEVRRLAEELTRAYPRIDVLRQAPAPAALRHHGRPGRPVGGGRGRGRSLDLELVGGGQPRGGRCPCGAEDDHGNPEYQQ